MQRAQIYLPKAHIAQLKETARESDTTMSDIVRLLVQTHIVNPRKKGGHCRTPRRTFYEETQGVLRNIEKTGERGPADLAEHMDDYLYGTM